MKGKFYTFTAGSLVPAWLFKADYSKMAREDAIHNAHHGKIIFGRSCVVVRGDATTYSKVMPMGNSYGRNSVIRIQKFRRAVIGGVAGATGVHMAPEGRGIVSAKLEAAK